MSINFFNGFVHSYLYYSGFVQIVLLLMASVIGFIINIKYRKSFKLKLIYNLILG
jgi:hypothetical protein